jgi:hypothetical protein
MSRAFLSSSAVERSTVNRLVASSNLAWGVYRERELIALIFFVDLVITTDLTSGVMDQNLRDLS